MGIKPQNMPQISNFPLSPNKSIVARVTNDNQGQTMIDVSSSENINNPKWI